MIFPFLFVQLAGWGPGKGFPFLRNVQLQTLSLPNTGMAVTMDIGEENDIHPLNKQDVGHRLALAARHVAYGENIVFSGPIYESRSITGGTVHLKFKHTGGGLAIGSAPPIRFDIPAQLPLDHLEGFVIAGADKQFVSAQAKIEKDEVIIWSDQIPAPVAVRYAWDPFPHANLYNAEGLPSYAAHGITGIMSSSGLCRIQCGFHSEELLLNTA